MKVLLDSDVLLDIGTAREPYFFASRNAYNRLLLERHEMFVTPVILANLTYFTQKHKNRLKASHFLEFLLRHCEVLPMPRSIFTTALNKSYADLEDGFQIEAAQLGAVDLILTRNIRHFQKAKIEVKTPELFLL